MAEKYVPPLAKGQRVVLVNDYCGVKAGTYGTITWTHPHPELPYRVVWDGVDTVERYIGIGMDDIGWLMRPDEIGVVG